MPAESAPDGARAAAEARASARAERPYFWVRTILLAGLAGFVAMLLWDAAAPVTTAIADPKAPWAWFWFSNPSTVQGVPFEESAYPVGPHVLWTIVIPPVPLLLMLFGQGLWRRVCPLGLLSRLPASLRPAAKARVLKGSHPLRTSAWTVQFGLLAVCLVLRHLFLDSSTLFLGLFLAISAATALASGFLWGGRTWCHALCPIAPVERIYSGACGLLERRFEDGSPRFAAARCSGQAPDLKPCLGCAKDCQDISPSMAHSAALQDPGAAFSHYAFFGLIAAFYGFFALHTGDPQHYFSGDWSHGADPLADLSSPGFWWNDAAFLPWIPKSAAAFLFVLILSAASWALGAASEAIVLRMAGAKDKDAAALWRHRVFTVWAFLSFVLFYAFAGRSNIALLPGWGRLAVDGLVAATALGWLAKSLRWTPPGKSRKSGKPGKSGSTDRDASPQG